jgi:hypothetical protein
LSEANDQWAAQLVPVADMQVGIVSRIAYPHPKCRQCFFRGVTPQPSETPVKACRTGLVRPTGHREIIVQPGERASMLTVVKPQVSRESPIGSQRACGACAKLSYVDLTFFSISAKSLLNIALLEFDCFYNAA